MKTLAALVVGTGIAVASVVSFSGESVVPPANQPMPVSAAPSLAAPRPTPSARAFVAPASDSDCHPSYSGCLRADASDYDCAGGSGNGPYYTGQVQVYGSDPFGLDRDNDGVGCE